MFGMTNNESTSALDLLKQDHDEVDAMFRQYEDMKDDGDQAAKESLVAKICEALTVHARPILILEGLLILDDPAVRQLMDIKIYVDADPDVRFIRRLKRDLTERGRTLDSIIRQYESSVRPMHLQFVEPSKRYADLVIPEGGYNVVAIDLLKTKIRALLSEKR